MTGSPAGKHVHEWVATEHPIEPKRQRDLQECLLPRGRETVVASAVYNESSRGVTLRIFDCDSSAVAVPVENGPFNAGRAEKLPEIRNMPVDRLDRAIGGRPIPGQGIR